jgi:hypothetical protein
VLWELLWGHKGAKPYSLGVAGVLPPAQRKKVFAPLFQKAAACFNCTRLSFSCGFRYQPDFKF